MSSYVQHLIYDLRTSTKELNKPICNQFIKSSTKTQLIIYWIKQAVKIILLIKNIEITTLGVFLYVCIKTVLNILP